MSVKWHAIATFGDPSLEQLALKGHSIAGAIGKCLATSGSSVTRRDAPPPPLWIALVDPDAWIASANYYFQANPADTLVLVNLGHACLTLKDPAKAREYFQRVIALDTSVEDSQAAKEGIKSLEAEGAGK
jgi:hypothetical protein